MELEVSSLYEEKSGVMAARVEGKSDFISSVLYDIIHEEDSITMIIMDAFKKKPSPSSSKLTTL